MPMRPAHVRIITRRASRRIMGSPGASHNVCGAAPTDRDVVPRDVRNVGRRGRIAWNVCRVCLERMGINDQQEDQ